MWKFLLWILSKNHSLLNHFFLKIFPNWSWSIPCTYNCPVQLFLELRYVDSTFDRDTIELKIISFDTDPNDLTDTKGVPEYYRLLPCDVMAIVISLQEYHLKDRAESPCRIDYPAELKTLLKTPLKPEWFSNAMLAPELPYDQRVCDDLCVTNYWLPRCGCVMSSESWYYLGGPENFSLTRCPEELGGSNDVGSSCIMNNAYLRTPMSEFVRCHCYKRCDGYAFTASAYDKYRFQSGEISNYLKKIDW